MVIFPPALVDTETVSLKNTRIGFDSHLRSLSAADITASSALDEAPADAPLRPETSEYWEPETLPATWVADLGSSLPVGYVGVLGTFGSNGVTIEARLSDDLEFNDYLRIQALDGNYVSTPDSAAVSITGDLHLELELAIDNADLPDYSLDFVGDFVASVAKITAGSPTVGTFARAGNTATRINESGLQETVLANVMRQAFSPVTRAARGFQVEGASANVVVQSQNFSVTWLAVGTPTISLATTTVGSLTLDTIGDDDAGVREGYRQTLTFTGDAVKALSVHVKKGTSTSSVVRLRDATAAVDRALAVITWSGAVPIVTMATGIDVTGSVEQLANTGVYRLLFQTTSVTAANVNSLEVYPASDNALSATGTGTIEMGGLQAENSTISTSYIPTTTVSVTRNADVATVTDITSWFNASEGTLIAQAIPPSDAQTGAFARVVELNNGTANELIGIYRSSGNSRFFVVDGGATQASPTVGTWTNATPAKVAGVYKLNDVAAVQDAGTVQTDSSATMPTVDRLQLGHFNGAALLNGYIQEFFYYATRRVNATLQDFSRQTYRVLASKWAETGNQRSWAVCLKENCAPVLFISTDGTAAGIREFHFVPLTVNEGARFRMRFKLDLAAGSPTLDAMATCETSDDDGDSWNALGTPVVQASISGIFDSTAPIEYGAFNGGTSELEARLFQFWLRGTLDGTVVAHFDAADAASSSASTITSADTGEVWTIHATGVTPATLVMHGFGDVLTPDDDSPIMFLDTEQTKRYLQIGVDGAGDAPRMAVAQAGPVLAMQRALRGGGVVPIRFARETILSQSLSRGGAFLGQSIRRNGIKGSLNYELLEQDWVDDEFLPFVLSARDHPFFIALRPETWPDDIGYCWATGDIHPQMMGRSSLMQVSIPYQGIGPDA